jgi:calcineurin-like phosphoesterase family protein
MKRTAAIVLTALCSAGCSGSSISPSPPPSPSPAVLVGAGDIADCATRGSELTAQLLDRISGTVVAVGDLAYPSGTAANFRDCYDPTWGRHRSRTRPAPGNHDYESAGAAPYFEYFGSRAGPPGLGYYSYDVGSWHVISLNSEIGVEPGSAQTAWLRADLSVNQVRCTVAYFHRPVFSSGEHGDQIQMREIWRILYEFGVEVVIVGHDHHYERFAPQDSGGRFDSARGIRQFIVGTGGAELRLPTAPRPNSEIRGVSWGVLMLTLEEGTYQWEFIPAQGASFRDAGVGQCH